MSGSNGTSRRVEPKANAETARQAPFSGGDNGDPFCGSPLSCHWASRIFISLSGSPKKWTRPYSEAAKWAREPESKGKRDPFAGIPLFKCCVIVCGRLQQNPSLAHGSDNSDKSRKQATSACNKQPNKQTKKGCGPC